MDWRAGVAQESLHSFRPDWVSLQYVCYAYHPKGLAWRWNPLFTRLGATAGHRHLMLHELWSGEGGHPPLKHRVIGLGQRWTVHHLHRQFQPGVVTTNTHPFLQRLARRGISARVLPLFGNIPMARRDDDKIAGLLGSAGSQIAQQPRNTFLHGVFFGTVHPDFDVQPLAGWLTELQRQMSKPVLLSMVGRAGNASTRVASQLIKLVPGKLELVPLGEQSEEVVSQSLQFADFGINTGSPEHLGKSGTFAAMREHGLPVVIADGLLDTVANGQATPPVMQFSRRDSVTELFGYARQSSPTTGVSQTALTMIQLLNQATA